MKQDRFLTGILIGIGILIVVALAVFFSRHDQASYVSDGTPDGVVHNYVLAVLNQDYEKAYGYLADLDHKPTFSEFRQPFAVGRIGQQDIGIKVGRAQVNGDSSAVEVTMVYSQGDPFGSELNNAGSAQLLLQNGSWKISSLPAYNLWDYSWYQAPPK
jgi:hypothetical protein